MKDKRLCSNVSYQGCDLNRYNNFDECILHCSKESTLSDYHGTFEMRSEFKYELINYIVKSIYKNKDNINGIDEAIFKEYLEISEFNTNENLKQLLKESIVVFNCISFPTIKNRDEENYEDILSLLGSIHFNYCNFYISGLDLQNVKCFFQDCEFHDSWNIKNYDILPNQSNVIYQMCKFHEGISASGRNIEEERLQVTNSQFCNCDFGRELVFEFTDIKSALFINDKSYKGTYDLLKLQNCNIEGRFILNNYYIKTVVIESSIFKDKFEFKKNKIDIFQIDNTNFKHIADFYDTDFVQFSIKKSIFDNFTSFEECKFGDEKHLDDTELISKFKYATFLNKINFRTTTFKNGLDIKHANFSEEPNFLNSEIESLHTSRETFRSIKHSFDTTGNYLDANKYFSLEMKKYREELKDKEGNKSEKLIFWLNEKISNFGQNYIRPIIILIFSVFFYCFIIYITSIDFGDKIPSYIISLNNLLNSFAKSIIHFKSLLTPGREFLSLAFSLWYSILIWQIIVSVKRHTRR
ncbi:hypothetical protein [Arcobacter peruensis]|uniref:hypothetical protein n=1 Tax=Arcobacter peruensis TaxID=2320140 RepID=UPI000F08B81B|nr:hypothetical protein [Arcobacter peruensis]